MKIMIVMAGTHRSKLFISWHQKYGNCGNLFSPFYFCSKTKKIIPQGIKLSGNLPYALDNGKFICYSRGIEWDESLFLKLCETALKTELKPLWIVVPDEVANREKTIELYYRWHDRLRKYDVPLALAVQDGMTIDDVDELMVRRLFDPIKDFIFIGGTTEWKLKTLPHWCKYFKNVHCARVNTWKRLNQAFECGCKSVDGTGFFRGGASSKQRNDLEYFLKVQAGAVKTHRQLSIFDCLNTI